MTDPAALQRSWRTAWSAAGDAQGEAPGDALFARLLAAWSEPQRSYHTLQHLSECVAHIGPHASLAVRPAEVELALWFHDAVYDVRAADNEARSAAWAVEAVRSAGASEAVAMRLEALVLVTRHDGAPATADEQLLVDIDLSILGAERDRFDEYEHQVAEEYAWVPAATYRARRSEVLAGFLARPWLFATAPFRDRLEAKARSNLLRSIAALAA